MNPNLIRIENLDDGNDGGWTLDTFTYDLYKIAGRWSNTFGVWSSSSYLLKTFNYNIEDLQTAQL